MSLILGDKVVINLKMEAKNLKPTLSRNSVSQITGHKKPEEVVLVSGHLDSWDVGNGAMDDGGGAFISWYSLVVLQELGLRPRRTIRFIYCHNCYITAPTERRTKLFISYPST
jgi:carboxypeptidase Q